MDGETFQSTINPEEGPRLDSFTGLFRWSVGIEKRTSRDFRKVGDVGGVGRSVGVEGDGDSDRVGQRVCI